MQKYAIVLAVLALASTQSGHALADTANVNVYGKVDVSYDSINTGNGSNGVAGTTATPTLTTPVTGTRSNRVSSNTTYLGFKGVNDLGDGWSAIWQIESVINIGDAAINSNTSGTFATRHSFLGLKSEMWGTLQAGRIDTPYKQSTRRFDAFTDGIADNRSLMGTGAVFAFDGRLDQVVVYATPALAGVSLAAAHANLAPANNVAGLNTNANSVAAWYDAHGLYATVAYEEHNYLGYSAAQAQSTWEKATKVGVGYTREGVFNLNVAYEKTRDNVGTSAAQGYNKDSHHSVYVSGKLNITQADVIKAAFTRLSSVTGVSSTGAKQVSVGYDHALSKTTTVYALYTKLSNDQLANYSLSSNATIGGASTVAGSGYGTAPSAIAVGLKVVF